MSFELSPSADDVPRATLVLHARLSLEEMAVCLVVHSGVFRFRDIAGPNLGKIIGEIPNKGSAAKLVREALINYGIASENYHTVAENEKAVVAAVLARLEQLWAV